jgi:hypothetical protein
MYVMFLIKEEFAMNRRQILFAVIGAMLLVSAGFSSRSEAGVNVNIGINIPAFRFAAPPPVVLLPGTYGYFVPDVDVDIFFYHDYWYRPYEGRWYRSRSYNGPWVFIKSHRVPKFFLDRPHDYRRMGPGYERIPYGQFKKNWKRWEREKYWDRHERREEMRHDRREERRDERREERPEHRGRGRY